MACEVEKKLEFTIVEARLRKNYGWRRVNPYCCVQVGQSVYETQPDVNGSKHPRWNETFLCDLPEDVDFLLIEIFNERYMDTDDRIAWAYPKIPVEMPIGEEKAECVVLSGRTGEEEGHIDVIFSWARQEANVGEGGIVPAAFAMPETESRENGEEIAIKVRQAERRAEEAEERCRVAERKMEDRVQTAERRANEAEGNLREAKGRAIELERRLETAENNARTLEVRLREACEERDIISEGSQKYEEKLQELESQWVVDREEIQLTGPELGRGGWATVSVATFRGVQVAAKCIHNQIISHYNIRLFKREMNMAARIRHPNLLQFIGATLKGQLIILTELMPTSLRKELESREEHDLMPLEQVTSIAMDVAGALNYLHLMQPHPLIHRDISSANTLLQPLPNNQWRAKVSDYGSVNLLQELHTTSPGNPTYSAPEAYDPTKQSPKMDIFSFGVLLVEMLTGEFPDSNNRASQLRKIHHRQLLTLVRSCLSQDKDHRPSAKQIIAQLNS